MAPPPHKHPRPHPPWQVRRVGVRKYASVNRSTFGLHGKKVIAVLRASGAILGE